MPNSIYSYQPIDPIECMGDSLIKINNNNFLADDAIGILETRIVAASASLNTRITTTSAAIIAQVQSTGKVLQVVTNIQSIGSDLKSTVIADTGLTPLNLTRTTTTSKILIELTGGRAYSAGYDWYTYFYVSENGGPLTNLVAGGVEYGLTGGGGTRYAHVARYVYTPGSGINSIAISVYYKVQNAAYSAWHLGGTEPIVLTMTEIAG